ncbi:MAG: AMP-binding protein [Gemmatimonadales bacterium]
MTGGELSVRAAAAEAPDRLALIADDHAYTFAELAASASRVARWLRARFPGGRTSTSGPVAVVAHRELEVIIALLAAFDLGVPVGLIHSRATERERRLLSELLGPALEMDPTTAAEGSEPAEGVVTLPTPVIHAESILAVVPTSGTSGKPKGVLLSRRAFLASARASAQNLGWEAGDRWLLTLPLAHIGGLSILVRALIARRCVVLAPPGRFDPVATLRTIERHRVTLASLVPSMLEALLEADPSWSPPGHLRALLLGGGPASRDLLSRAADRGVPVLTTYGLTESCSQVTTQRYGTRNRGELGSGAPLDGVELRIIDGEIQVRGPMLFSGYAERGRVWPGVDAEGWLVTGDEGELDAAGQLHVHGRLDRLIVTGGENVDPLEVEHALGSLTSVRGAVVFGVEDARWGVVVAAALVAEGGDPEPDVLREEMAAILAPYKRPRLVRFLADLPTTPGGKVDRTAAEAAARQDLRPI